MPDTTHAEFIQGLRELADFYQAHPEVKLPHLSATIIEATRAQILEGARAFGKAEKHYYADSFWLRKQFSGGVLLEFYTDRKTVCTPVVVGVTLEPEHLIPAEPARMVPAREVPKIKWRCDPILAETTDPAPWVDSDIPF